MLCLGMSAAKKDHVKSVIRTWHIPQPTYVADTLRLDTSFINQPLRGYLNDYSIANAWNGSLISPVQSKLYFDRQHKLDDFFGEGYQPYIITAQDVQFYNTTVPYSNVGYRKDFTNNEDENEINFLFTGNINRRTNLGMQINYLNAQGHYLNSENKLLNGAIFGSYNGNHYSFQGAFSFATLSNFENGGIKNTEDLGGVLQSMDIPVNIQGMSGYRYLSGFFNHYYSITVEREHHDTIEVVNEMGEKERIDTVTIEYIPVTTFAHTFETNNSERRYIEQKASQGFFAHNYRSDLDTHDSTAVLTIRNTLTVTFEEEFNTKLKFGANVYATNECQRYLFREGQVVHDGNAYFINNGDSLRKYSIEPMLWNDMQYQWVNNTFVGGSLYKNRGRILRYGFNGDVCVLGYKIGQFQVNGHLEGCFKLGQDSLSVAAQASFRNEMPSFYFTHFTSNHYQWENNFSKPMYLQVGGKVAYPTQWVKPSVDVRFENITHPIYFDHKGVAQQLDGNAQVIAANVHCDVTTPWFNLENNVVWQHSTSEVVPLPTIALYHNWYYHGTWFKALDAQIGVDLRYHTKYYAPVLNPATGQFCVQHDVQIGNYPDMNIYINFYVRSIHLKFFAQYAHCQQLFMRSSKECLIMPNYPYNPGLFRAGLAWSFYR